MMIINILSVISFAILTIYSSSIYLNNDGVIKNETNRI